MKKLKVILLFLLLMVGGIANAETLELKNGTLAKESVKNISEDKGSSQLKSSVIKLDISERTDNGKWAKAWRTVKGKPTEDALLLGMFSYHTSTKRDYQDTNNLIGFQYKGISAGTFVNSYDNQSVYVAFARDIYTKRFEKLNMDYKLGYKAGVLYGYKDKYPNLGGITAVILPINSLDFKAVGVDFWIIPDDHPTFATNFRINYNKQYFPFNKLVK